MQPAPVLFKKFFWLVNEIYRSDGITRDELSERWRKSSLNDNKEEGINERTFHRHKNAIKELFDIDIVCERGSGKKYYIANRDELEDKGFHQWLLNSFAVSNMISESKDLRNRILFEEIPSGQKFLIPIMEAMKRNRVIKIRHHKFEGEEYDVELEPYCLKVAKQRWYVFGKRIIDGKLRVYSLDRIGEVKEIGKEFSLPTGFDAEAYFEDCIGIIIGAEKPQYIEIKVDGNQQNYVRSLPIHHSQQESEKKDEYSIFSYYVRPTFDFIQELLKHGENLEVLKPEWLREQLKNTALEMLAMYESKR